MRNVENQRYGTAVAARGVARGGPSFPAGRGTGVGACHDGDAMSPAALTFRLARATAFAVVCLGLALGAHLFAGGAVTWRGVGVGLAVGFAAAMPLSGRERTLRTIMPLLGAVQVVLHLLFSTWPAMAADGTPIAPLQDECTPTLGMLIAHAWAAGLTAVWLARGEAALWRLLRGLAVRLIRLLTGPSVPNFASPVPVRVDRERPRHQAPPRHVISWRGPPFLPAASAA